MAQARVPSDPALSAIANRYRNPERALIADAVLPRVRVDSPKFEYIQRSLEHAFTVPDTRVGRTSQPNQVEDRGEKVTDQVEDFGLDDPVPQRDQEAAGEGFNPEADSTEYVTDLVMLHRELRVAAKVFDLNTYLSAQRTTLSGGSQWSDPASDPVGAILTAMDAMIMRPNIMVLGQAVWTKLRTHPKVVKAVRQNSGDSGIVMRQEVAELFELREILVGEGYYNFAREGQAADMRRVWGKHCALLHRDGQASTTRRMTFGFTAQWGERSAARIPDPDIGLKGGVRIRVGEMVRELVSAPPLGYFFQNAVA